MPPKRQVYLLDPQRLSPETIAVTFAKTSRSPQSFGEIAAQLSDEKSADFNEKWVVGYGHASVAEHAVLHIAIENVSRLAVETLESNRLASYTEKSSRYQVWSNKNFFNPSEFAEHSVQALYLQACEMLFEAYEQALPLLELTAKSENPRLREESESAYQHRTHSLALDVCRYYLPASALANVGITINARELEHAISKMLSHPLCEVRDLGSEIKNIACDKVPTLLKYAAEIPSLVNSFNNFSIMKSEVVNSPDHSDWCRIIAYDADGENRILAALLFRHSHHDYSTCLKSVTNLPETRRKELAQSLLGKLGPHDIPLRELEYASLLIDLVLDQGAFGELKRHRMMTFTPQALSINEGYVIPRLITAAGLEKKYCELMGRIFHIYQELNNFNSDAASYILPNAFNRRVLMGLNIRSAYHLVRLRSSPQAHFAMRRVAGRILEEIQKLFPLFAPYFGVTAESNWREIERTYFTQV